MKNNVHQIGFSIDDISRTFFCSDLCKHKDRDEQENGVGLCCRE
jgi:hypothetical protein